MDEACEWTEEREFRREEVAEDFLRAADLFL
jgi:hypothetical protein